MEKRTQLRVGFTDCRSSPLSLLEDVGCEESSSSGGEVDVDGVMGLMAETSSDVE